MIKEAEIVTAAESFARETLWNDLPENMTYHSLNHTVDVVESALEIGRQQNVSEDDLEVLQVAAWFHDLGYSKGCNDHEKIGAEMAEGFLSEKGYSQEKIQKVKGCIMATQMPQNPQNNLEQIICDADLMHLADEDYFTKADLLHKEIEHTNSCKISEQEWMKMNEDFLDQHCFFTDYARNRYESKVKENLKKVSQRLKTWVKKEK
ncbi:MAG: HD domain-containing protein [Cyclobacteriaceae bacterium]